MPSVHQHSLWTSPFFVLHFLFSITCVVKHNNNNNNKYIPVNRRSRINSGHAWKKGVWLAPRESFLRVLEMRIDGTVLIASIITYLIVITLQSLVKFMCPYLLHKIPNFWKHSPSFFYWEVDRYADIPLALQLYTSRASNHAYIENPRRVTEEYGTARARA